MLLDMGDMMEVTGYLKDLNKSQIYNLGLVLGLDYSHVVDLRDNCGSNQDFLDAVVVNWFIPAKYPGFSGIIPELRPTSRIPDYMPIFPDLRPTSRDPGF